MNSSFIVGATICPKSKCSPSFLVKPIVTCPGGQGKEFQKTPYAKRLERTGVILSYICPLMYMNNPLSGKMPVITCSNKLRTYTTARYYTEYEILSKITGGAGK